VPDELFQVAVFLSSFAELDDELARAVGVRAVYRAVQRGVRSEPDSAGDQRH